MVKLEFLHKTDSYNDATQYDKIFQLYLKQIPLATVPLAISDNNIYRLQWNTVHTDEVSHECPIPNSKMAIPKARLNTALKDTTLSLHHFLSYVL